MNSSTAYCSIGNISIWCTRSPQSPRDVTHIMLLYRKKLHTAYPMLHKPTLKNSKKLNDITGGRPSTSVNGDIAIQWELSNFDPSQNQNPLTDNDKTLHN